MRWNRRRSAAARSPNARRTGTSHPRNGGPQSWLSPWPRRPPQLRSGSASAARLALVSSCGLLHGVAARRARRRDRRTRGSTASWHWQALLRSRSGLSRCPATAMSSQTAGFSGHRSGRAPRTLRRYSWEPSSTPCPPGPWAQSRRPPIDQRSLAVPASGTSGSARGQSGCAHGWLRGVRVRGEVDRIGVRSQGLDLPVRKARPVDDLVEKSPLAGLSATTSTDQDHFPA